MFRKKDVWGFPRGPEALGSLARRSTVMYLLPANCALTARRCSTLNSRSAIALEHACSSALSPLTGHAFLERR